MYRANQRYPLEEKEAYRFMQHSTSRQRPLRALYLPEYSQEDWVNQLSQSSHLKGGMDRYGNGELIQELEQRVAQILGKPSALFFTKGMVAQFCALKVAETNSGSRAIALHPLSHIAFDEANSYRELLQLKGILLGNNMPFGREELSKVNEKLALVSVELPLRRAGFILPEWEQLIDISQWCSATQVYSHLDGARLWESTHFYQKSEAHIASLFDSVYVSFYKGLGGLGGAVLAGSEAFIEQCKIWRTRFGGDAYTIFPHIVTALDGLEHRLKRMPEYVLRAQDIAQRLSLNSQLTVTQPQTNAFVVYLQGEKEHLDEKSKMLNLEKGLKLFGGISFCPFSERLMLEIQVGAEHDRISNQEIEDYFIELLN